MVALAAIAVVGISSALKRLRVRTASSKAQDLASLWVGGIETMLDVPGAGTPEMKDCCHGGCDNCDYSRVFDEMNAGKAKWVACYARCTVSPF